MSQSSASDAEPPAEAGSEGLVEVGAYESAAAGFEHGLVALAIGAPFWLMPGGTGFRLCVRTEDAAGVRAQLGYFREESASWPPVPWVDKTPRRRAELLLPLGWAVVVAASFWMQARVPGWTAAGALEAQGVFGRGEWWRVFTALFLHADTGHFVSNLLSGIFVFSAVLTTMGRWRGGGLLLLAAVTGNLAAVAIHAGAAYRSIGASTAVFAGLGLLTGRAVRRAFRRDHPHRWRTMFVPLAAGLAVLGLFGAGDVRVDVIAHLTGFVAGLALGFAAARDD